MNATHNLDGSTGAENPGKRETRSEVKEKEFALEQFKANEDWKHLVTLVRDAGGFISTNIAPHFFPGSGRGLVALAPLKQRELFMALPASLFVHGKKVLELHPTWSEFFVKYQPSNEGLTTLFVARARKRIDTFEKDSNGVLPRAVYDYLQKLPVCANAMFVTGEVLRVLPTWTRPTIRMYQKVHNKAWERVRAYEVAAKASFNVSKAEFLDSMCHFMSRNFQYDRATNTGTLCPLLDWMNHRTPMNAVYQRDTLDVDLTVHGDAYVGYAVRDIGTGDEIVTDYGSKTAGAQLGTYGFYDGGTHEHGARSWLPEIPLHFPMVWHWDATYDRKISIARYLLKSPTLSLGRLAGGGYGFEENSITALRCFLLTEDEYTGENIAKILNGTAFSSRKLDWGKVTHQPIVSESHESRVRDHLRSQCALALASIPPIGTDQIHGGLVLLTRISDHVKYPIGNSDADQRLKQLLENAVKINVDHRRILNNCIETFSH